MPDQELGSPESLSSAVESVTMMAPALSGLDKLKAQSEFVKKNDSLPPKEGAKAAETPKTPAPVASAPVLPTGTPEEQAAAKAAFQADFKYKAQGKEFEIPEKYRALITDKASEEELKTLFGKAATNDELKATATGLKENLTKVGGELNKYSAGVAILRKNAEQSDWDTFFKNMNIHPEKIYKWVLDKVNYNQLPPEEQRKLDAQRDLQRQNYAAQEKAGNLDQVNLALRTQLKEMQLDIAFGKTDVKAMEDAFDARVGTPGSFKAAVIRHGQAVWALSNGQTDLTPTQAVEDFVKQYGNPASLAPAKLAEAGGAAPVAQTGAASTPAVKVIPNVAGRSSSSPVKQGVRSIDDLKRRAKELQAESPGQGSQGYLAG